MVAHLSVGFHIRMGKGCNQFELAFDWVDDNRALRFMEGSVPAGPLPSSYSLPLPLCLRSVRGKSRDHILLSKTNILISIDAMDRKRLGLGGRLR